MEDQNRPRRDLKGLWLLPVLAAGLYMLVGSWKKMPLSPPTLTAEQRKREIYLHTKSLLLSRIVQGQPKGFTVTGFASYSDGTVAQIGPDRFSCSGSLTVRSPSGAVEKERWQCIFMESQDHWTSRNFQLTPPERLAPVLPSSTSPMRRARSGRGRRPRSAAPGTGQSS